MDGRLAVVRGSVGSDYRGFTFIRVASLRLASRRRSASVDAADARVADGRVTVGRSRHRLAATACVVGSTTPRLRHRRAALC